MATPNSNYTKGSLLQDFYINALVNNREVDGIVEEGQAEYVTMKIIEESNSFYEKAGTGNKILDTYEDRVAYLGDPTIQAQISSRVPVTGGIRINFADSNYDAFRVNDDVDTRFAANQAKVVESGAGYIVVAQRDGYAAPQATDYPVSGTVIVRKRSINMRGTSAPEGVYQVPQIWKNHVSVIDDGGQESTFDSLIKTNIINAGDYIINVPIRDAVMRMFRYRSANFWTSKNVNPETNGMRYTATSGIIEQIQNGGMFYPMSSLITKQEFENRLRTWFLTNPANSMRNRIIKTGSIGFALVSSWYQDLIKFDATIAVSFTDGSINGLNATKIFIPGFEGIALVKDTLQDMQQMGELTSLSGFSGLPKTSGDFYFMDLSPVVMKENGMTAPALQKFCLREKYFYGFEQGLRPASNLQSAFNGQALTAEAMEMTSTTKDFSSFRIWVAEGINVMNRSAHAYLQNLV